MTEAKEDTFQPDRRGALKCMAWAGAGMVWTMAGGAPSSRLLGSAYAANAGFTFVQISDSHIGFDKPVNPDPGKTLADSKDPSPKRF